MKVLISLLISSFVHAQEVYVPTDHERSVCKGNELVSICGYQCGIQGSARTESEQACALACLQKYMDTDSRTDVVCNTPDEFDHFMNGGW